MEDCRVVLTVKDGKVSMEGERISMVDLAGLCGVLQVLTGTRAMALGMDLDDMKDNMLGVHLDAMRTIEKQQEKGEGN